MPEIEKRIEQYLDQTLKSAFTITSGPLVYRRLGTAFGEFIFAFHLFCSRITQAFAGLFNQIMPE